MFEVKDNKFLQKVLNYLIDNTKVVDIKSYQILIFSMTVILSYRLVMGLDLMFTMKPDKQMETLLWNGGER